MAALSFVVAILVSVLLQKRKATKTPERLVNEAVYQLQKKYTELGQPKMSEKMWEKLLVQTMEQMGVKAEPQAKIQEVFSDFVPAPKYADVMLERKVGRESSCVALHAL